MTPFQNIYDKFLSLIDDYELAIIADEDLKFLLQNYLNRAISLDFKQCKKDLTDVDLVTESFNESLSDEEQWIIAVGMSLSWVEPRIKKERLMRAAISDRDYQESSHANQLKTLIELERTMRQKLDRYLVNYTYNDFDGLY